MGGEESHNARSRQMRTALEVEVCNWGGFWDGEEGLVVDESVRDIEVREVREQWKKRFKDWFLQRGTFVQGQAFEIVEWRGQACRDTGECLWERARRAGAEVECFHQGQAEELGDDVDV